MNWLDDLITFILSGVTVSDNGGTSSAFEFKIV